MTVSLSPGLESLINQAPRSKTGYSQAYIAGLGDTRRLILSNNGTPFLNVGMTGEMTIAAGNITGFGNAEGVTVRQAADLLPGGGTLRIEGNGQWYQASLGLTREAQIAARIAAGMTQAEAEAAVVAYDYYLPANPTETSGYGFVKGAAGLKPPRFYPSGTGPAAPGPHPKMPAGIRVWTYANDDYDNPILAGTAYANVRDDDIVPERPYMAAQMGDIKLMRCADGSGVVVGTGGDCYRFAVRVMSTNKSLNAEFSVPTHHARVNCVPHGRWAGFPFMKNLDLAYDTMSPQAFKVELFSYDNTTLEWFEMFSTRVNGVPGTGKPINSNVHGFDHVQPNGYQPWWTCNMTLIYSSHETKPNQFASHFVPLMDEDAMSWANVTAYAGVVDQHPPITRNYGWNGLGHWRVAPKWSRKLDTGFDTNIIDPFMGASQAARDNYRTQLIGTHYEPGSTGTQVWFMGPGGSRDDRYLWSHALVRWVNDPTGFRPHGNVPLNELAREFLKCFSNHGVHWYTNLERGIGISKAKTLAGEYCINDYYYKAASQNFRNDVGNHAVRWLALTNQQHYPGNGFKDKNGRNFANDYSRDLQHNQTTGADYSILMANPHGMIEATHFFHAMKATAFDLTMGFHVGQFLTRQHAWYFSSHVKAWMCAAKHHTLFSSAEIEQSMAAHLEWVYDAVFPRYTADTVEGATFRNLGSMIEYGVAVNGRIPVSTITDSKAFYMGMALLLAKQSGMWDVMKAYSAKCAWALDTMVKCLAKQSVDCFLDGGGRIDNGGPWGVGYSFPVGYPTAPSGWNDFLAPVGQWDWVRLPDGQLGGVDWDEAPLYYGPGKCDVTNTKHARAQFVYILMYWFPEFDYPRVAEAKAMVDAFYTAVQTSPNAWFSYRFPYFGRPQAPELVGPPVV